MAKKNDTNEAGQINGQLEQNFKNTPESDQGGAGNAAGPAGAPSTEELIAAGAETSRRQLAEVRETLAKGRDEFKAMFPHLAAAIDAWEDSDTAPLAPTALRIVAKVDGFRRAGVAHSKAGVDHPLEAFPSPIQLEQLFSEPNLVVTFISELEKEIDDEK
ncbi:MAG TPA: HI1506-related protein [Mesorhizobium sp.]|jgi:hypothetical protein|uniref:HI1506-related protein n=1 Tax=Mesorhizobium sp. TaxID=1871066 RepID=UPI002DDD55A1|nr:HI1506-related protein [Mesorhizobium sp.]HEV2501611.1 HI1506-related protein [Mesorhizobium sp.]